MVWVAPLVWNKTVAIYAQNYANKLSRTGKCVHTDMKHSTGLYGENIAIGWVQPKDQMSGPISAKFWYLWHYTQIVANQSTMSVVARTSHMCHNNKLIWIICNYYPKPMGDANTRPY
ncbi:hypothetical protein N665_0383s0210 [Sinapis alba]|nr:hypothetical protein N665_0383s0210 [Sinapis alba]